MRPGAHQPGDADDLAAPDVQVDVLDHLPIGGGADDRPTSPRTSNTGLADLRLALADSGRPWSRPTMLRMIRSSLDRLGPAIERVDGAAVAQHGDAVGDAGRPR